MNVLWEIQRGFPRVIMENMDKPIPPYNTVLSTIRKLEQNNYIGYKKYGKSHEYFPMLKKSEYSQSIFKTLYYDLMGGSQEELLSFFVQKESISLEELESIIEKLKKANDD